MTEFLSPDNLLSAPGFSQVAVIPSGPLVWTSGQVPVGPDGVAPEGWQAQSELVFANVTRALEAGGATWSDVVKLTAFIVSLDGIAEVRAARNALVDAVNPPTLTLVQVAGLSNPDWLLEVEAVAAPR